jgi:hypothetical protein
LMNPSRIPGCRRTASGEGWQGFGLDAHLCSRDLVWEHRGQSAKPSAWAAYRKNPQMLAGWKAVKQIESLCSECYLHVTRASFLPGGLY